MRGGQWGGLGVIALGLASYGMAWSMVRSDAEDRRIAIAQQSYAEGKCTITDSEVIEWRHDKPDEVIRGSTIETTLTVHTPKGDVKDATYRYSDTYWMPLAAKKAVETTHKRGSRPWLLASIFAVPLILAGLLGLLIKPDGKKRIED